MKILFVVNNYYFRGNGLSNSARRTVTRLKERGLDVKVLSGRSPYDDGIQPEFCLGHKKLLVFDELVHSQGYVFAKKDKKIIREALEWADLVHLEEPFLLQVYVAKVASRMGVPLTGTYHLHPENMLASINLHKWRFVNNAILLFWRDFVFNKCSDVQCPTENVMERLRRFGFRSRLHLISNGIIPAAAEHVYPEKEGEPYVVSCIGRYSVEKDQKTLFKAMRHSRNASRIQLVLAGRGPLKEKYEAMAASLVRDGVLKYPPVMEFMEADGLRELAARSDLYIHCATVEVEGLSCLEALEKEVVPIIAEGRLTATSQFALDSRSVFKAENAAELAEKIDWWLEHPEERHAMARRYASSMEGYDITSSIDQLVALFESVYSAHAAREGK